jgi:hypothetical protein
MPEETLWNNPMINNARKHMSPEDLEKYKMMGESMYGDIDFPTSKIITENNNSLNLPEHMVDALMYIIETIKSGLHPSMLEENEIKLLEEAYGNKWYEQFGYVKEDLTDIVTL